MKFFLDTAEVEQIKKAADLGMLDGVTTNPTLVMKSGRSHKEVIEEIAQICKGPISVEGAADDYEGLIKEAEEFSTWIPNAVFKVPMTPDGLRAVQYLSKKGIKTNVTLVFSPSQALLVARAGATYVSPFIGRLDVFYDVTLSCNSWLVVENLDIVVSTREMEYVSSIECVGLVVRRSCLHKRNAKSKGCQ